MPGHTGRWWSSDHVVRTCSHPHCSMTSSPSVKDVGWGCCWVEAGAGFVCKAGVGRAFEAGVGTPASDLHKQRTKLSDIWQHPLTPTHAFPAICNICPTSAELNGKETGYGVGGWMG